jgi:hypothetical protein
MAIIMDNEEHQRRIIMKDNGYGTNTNEYRLQGKNSRNFHKLQDRLNLNKFIEHNKSQSRIKNII